MQEQIRPTPESENPPASLGSIFDPNSQQSGIATVSSGPYAEQLPVANSTVGQIRARFRVRFDIDPRSQAVLDGRDVSDDIVVRTGQVLMFTHRIGEKGHCAQPQPALPATATR